MLSFIIGAAIGAAFLSGGFYFGFKVGKRLAESKTEAPPKKRGRKPKCYVLDPKDFGEEERTE